MKSLKVAITGGIGSGKSYVCKIFRDQYHIPVYDSDRMAQELLLKEDIKIQIINDFGIDSYIDNKFNKEKFKNLLFDNQEALDKINEILKPELIKDINNWCNDQTYPYVIIECAIVFENNLQNIFDKIITVSAPLELRIERLLKRGVDYDKITKIMNIQLSDEEKMKQSDIVILNDETLSKQIDNINEIFKTGLIF